MNRLLRFFLGKMTAAVWICGRKPYMSVRLWYLRRDGITFHGRPHFIHPSARLDSLGGVSIEDNVTISANVFVLTHDYAITKGLRAAGEQDARGVAIFERVTIGANCFLGLGCVLLPGTVLGRDVIVGAGSVVRGTIPPNSVIIGNPASVIARTDEWARKCIEKKKAFLHYDTE